MTTTLDPHAPAPAATWSATTRRVLLATIGASLVLALAVAVLGTASANGHAQLHGGTGAVLLLVAAGLAWRGRAAGLIAALPAIGLAAFAIPMLVEGVGALGYDAVTQARTSDLANLHDVGLVTTSLGMLVLVVALAATIGLLIDRRTSLPRAVAVAVAVVLGVVGVLATKVLVGGV